MIRRATIDEIEAHLLKLDGGNHEDNMKIIRGFPRHYLLTLSESEFHNLVFLQTTTIFKIVPRGSDRRLAAVAQRASQLPPTEANLGSNWDITATVARFRNNYLTQTPVDLRTLVLRDTRNSECQWTEDGWYLQDGSHRALAYSMEILTRKIQYFPQLAFCATSKHLNERA